LQELRGWGRKKWQKDEERFGGEWVGGYLCTPNQKRDEFFPAYCLKRLKARVVEYRSDQRLMVFLG
jgi:hypothetical protein